MKESPIGDIIRKKSASPYSPILEHSMATPLRADRERELRIAGAAQMINVSLLTSVRETDLRLMQDIGHPRENWLKNHYRLESLGQAEKNVLKAFDELNMDDMNTFIGISLGESLSEVFTYLIREKGFDEKETMAARMKIETLVEKGFEHWTRKNLDPKVDMEKENEFDHDDGKMSKHTGEWIYRGLHDHLAPAVNYGYLKSRIDEVFGYETGQVTDPIREKYARAVVEKAAANSELDDLRYAMLTDYITLKRTPPEDLETKSKLLQEAEARRMQALTEAVMLLSQFQLHPDFVNQTIDERVMHGTEKRPDEIISGVQTIYKSPLRYA